MLCNLFLFLLFGFISGQDVVPSYQQVPVCAPITPHGSQQASSSIRGPKGDRGNPGKRGANGMDGRDGTNGATGRKGDRGFPGYSWGSGDCPGVTFHLLRYRNITDYIRYRAYFPSMAEATACMWLEIERFNTEPTPMSYAVSSQANEWVMFFQNANSRKTTRYFLRHASFDDDIPNLETKSKFHYCTWVSSKRGQFAQYVNATRVSLRSIDRHAIRGGGDLILGQEQDAPNAGSFQAHQAYNGNITNFMIWPRVLTDQEISDIARNCDCPWDYSVTMTLDRAELHGEATYSLYDECPTL